MKNKYFLWILISILAVSCITSSVNDFGVLGKADDYVPLTQRAITGTLPNGLRYYIMENAYPENRAHLVLAINAGSVLEEDNERGIAHFVEHLAFNTTARFPNPEIIEYLRSLGMRFGADANAHTSYNETVYNFDVPVEIVDGVKKIPDKALAILDDWSHAVSFLPEEIKNESRVVLEEFRMRKGADDRIRKRVFPLILEGSAYVQREVIGLENVIENADSGLIRNFYQRWYTSNNMALIFVGDFDGKALEASLIEHFNIPSSQMTTRPTYSLPPPQRKFNIEIITDPELTTTDYEIYYKQKPDKSTGTIGAFYESIIDYLISSMLNLRFTEAQARPASASVSSWGGKMRWFQDSHYYILETQSKQGRFEEALSQLLLEKESIQRFGFTQTELDRAKLNLTAYLDKQLAEKDRQNSRTYIRGFTRHFIYGEDMADIEWEIDAAKIMLPRIGIKEITRASKEYFSYDDCIVILTAPESEKANLPGEERIKEIFAQAAKAKIQPRKDTKLSGELLSQKPAAGTIVSQTKDNDTGSVIFTLSNGAVVIAKETKNKNSEITLYALAKGGEINVQDDEAISAELASQMIEVSGLGPYSRIELVNKLTGKQVSFSFWTRKYYRGIQGASTTKDIKTLFEMLHLFFTQPRFDEEAIEAMLEQLDTNLSHQEEDPNFIFTRELHKLVYGGNHRFMPMESGDLQAVSVEQAVNFISNCLNPADYTFIFTGNINIKELQELCAQYIASIPVSTAMNAWVDPKIVRPEKTNVAVYKGKEDKSTVSITWFAAADQVFNEEKSQTAALLSEYLEILLTDEIREKMGGVYSIGSYASVDVIPAGESHISVYFICDPARAAELSNAVKDRITEIHTKALNMDIFNKAREALLKEHENAIQGNLHIARSYANSSVLYGLPLSRLNSRPEIIKKVKPQDVQDLCRAILKNGAIELILYPERN